VNRPLYRGPHKWFAWYPVEVGALGGSWVWLRTVMRVPGIVTIHQLIDVQ
jgi:hypothetical protein